MTNIAAFNYNNDCGVILNAFSKDELLTISNRMLTYQPTLLPEYGLCYGVDVNHPDYCWFLENVFARLQQLTNKKLKLIFGMYADFDKSFRIHRDIKPIPENGVPAEKGIYASFLVPISIDYNPNLCSKNQTLIFERDIFTSPASEQPWHPLVADSNKPWRNDYYNVDNLDHRFFNLKQAITWNIGDLIWWNSLMPHCGLDPAAAGFTQKQMLVIHTYV